MVKLSGNFGSQQTANGVVELLSPLTMIWRRPIEWGGTSALGSDGVSVTFTNTNLPKEGEVVKIGTDGKAAYLTGAETDANMSLGLVWTGYEQHDSGAVDTITMIDSNYMLFDVDASRIDSATAGEAIYWSASAKQFTTDTTSAYAVGVCEMTGTVRGGNTFTRIKWSR